MKVKSNLTHPDDSCVATRVVVDDHSARNSTIGDEHLANKQQSRSMNKGSIMMRQHVGIKDSI